ncbi:MAG: hypothetical protein IGBAC_0074 [Ignavibacteriae bacterium]|nr:MAG: hypothetical protein IGBAC_0074 [Ignavibacteriota bacterium]
MSAFLLLSKTFEFFIFLFYLYAKKGCNMKKYIFLFLIILFNFTLSQQPTYLTPPENLVIDGIPSIPLTIVEQVGRYTEFRSAVFQSWHPERKEMLILTRFAETPQVHLIKFPGGARTQLTFLNERIGGAIFNPQNSDYFVFSKDIGGGEWFQNYRFDLNTGTITLLTDGKSKNTLGPFSKDGKYMTYTSTRRNGKDTDLYIVEPQNPATDKLILEVEGGGWEPLDFSNDGKYLLVKNGISINESYLYLVNLNTGEKELITEKKDEKVAYMSAQFSKDDKGIFLTTDLNSEFLRLAYYDFKTKAYKFFTSDINWDVEDFDLSPDGKSIIFTTNEDGISIVRLLNVETGKVKKFDNIPIGVISGLKWHNNGKDIGFSMSSARSATDVYSLDVKTGKLERWTESETGGLNVKNFSQPELIKWKSFDGRTITGFLYMPPEKYTGKKPVIINIHGGPESQFRPTFLGRNNYYLNELGIAIIFPNIRGSSGYGKTFLKLDNGYLREDSYKDIDALLEWIKTQPQLDSDRIMITGGSYGGHMTLAVATYYPEKIRCAVDIVGISNLVTFLENTESYRRDLRRVEYGDERDPEMRKFLEKIAPLNNAHKITKPMFIVQGKNDPRVPASEAEQMVEVLKKNNIPVWYLLAKDEGHGFVKKKNADFQFYSTVMFIKEYLLK